MNSQYNNDKMFNEFRPVFYNDDANEDSPHDKPEQKQEPQDAAPVAPVAAVAPEKHLHDYLIKKKPAKSPKFVRKQRSRSLPIISYNSHKLVNCHKNLVPPLPPINLTSLKEIDLHEILKNPQLRHDVLFDPQLQFRPNLDGERGKRKKSIIDKYWYEIYKECYQFFQSADTPRIVRLPMLFQTLKDILLSLLPLKDRALIHDILDIDLIVQQLNHNSFDFLSLSVFLAKIFKNHCAPMRDELVNKMAEKFQSSFDSANCDHLIDGLKLIFQILESMKLDIANHQIRILRPILVETAIDFEKDYFKQLIAHSKINLVDSVNWYNKNYETNHEKLSVVSDKNTKHKLNLVHSVFNLLSCKKMINEFPNTLTFDHTRLILLRADIRQLVVVKLCKVLYRNMVLENNPKKSLLTEDNLSRIKQEVLSIVTDSNGNIKWTKNIQLISIQLVKNLELKNPSGDSAPYIPEKLLSFANSWLVKQIQPTSKVYQLMEDSFFKQLIDVILPKLNTPLNINLASYDNSIELNNIANRLLILIKFNWSVFGGYYVGDEETSQ